MLMILARLVRSESFWAVVKVRSPHTGPEVCYIIRPIRLCLPLLLPFVGFRLFPLGFSSVSELAPALPPAPSLDGPPPLGSRGVERVGVP